MPDISGLVSGTHNVLDHAQTMAFNLDGYPMDVALTCIGETLTSPPPGIRATHEEHIERLASLCAILMLHLHREHRCSYGSCSYPQD